MALLTLWRRWPMLILAPAVLVAACGIPQTASQTAAASPTAGAIEGDDASKLPGFPAPGATPSPSSSPASPEAATATFDDIQAKWSAAFAEAGLTYTPASFRLFTSGVGTACGPQTSEVGPFYCPADQTVNMDLNFFAAMERQFGVRGFAIDYVIAHEVAHHVQSLLGIMTRVAMANHNNPAGANALSVRVELQADCLAGVWAHTAYARDLITANEIGEALRAAAVVGDDFQASLRPGQTTMEDWTHGSSAQRQRWFTTGFDSGSPAACDTFSGRV